MYLLECLKMHRFFGLFTIGLLLFDVVCIIVATSLDYWVYFDNNKQNVHSGIWRLCVETKSVSNSTCDSVDGDSDYTTVRAMVILPLIMVVGAIVCIVIKLFVMKTKTIILIITAVILFVAGLFLMIGFGVYHTKVLETVRETYSSVAPHACFALCIIAWLVTWTATGVTALMIFVKEIE